MSWKRDISLILISAKENIQPLKLLLRKDSLTLRKISDVNCGELSEVAISYGVEYWEE